MKYLSVFSDSSNLLPVFINHNLVLLHTLGTGHFKIWKTWISRFSASPLRGKTGQNKILFWEEREKNTCHQPLKHISQFPAQKSCQYFKWQFLLYKYTLVSIGIPKLKIFTLTKWMQDCSHKAHLAQMEHTETKYEKSKTEIKFILKQWASLALCIDWLSQQNSGMMYGGGGGGDDCKSYKCWPKFDKGWNAVNLKTLKKKCFPFLSSGNYINLFFPFLYLPPGVVRTGWLLKIRFSQN